MTLKDGIILKSIGGFYSVKISDKIYECKARGIFRQKSVMPLVGDRVFINVLSESDMKGIILKIDKRKNSLIRPPISNIDNILLVNSLKSPNVNTFNIDKILLICEYKNINPILIFTKLDLVKKTDIADIYIKSNYTVRCIINSEYSLKDDHNLCAQLSGKINILMGNSGVGKSTFINSIDNTLHLKVSDISKKLGRGKHTTRNAELFYINDIGYIGDTCGFSSIDVTKYISLSCGEVKHYFREFKEYSEECKFRGCDHINEEQCNVLNAVKKNIIPLSRYKSYVRIYDELKNAKEWK